MGVYDIKIKSCITSVNLSDSMGFDDCYNAANVAFIQIQDIFANVDYESTLAKISEAICNADMTDMHKINMIALLLNSHRSSFDTVLVIDASNTIASNTLRMLTLVYQVEKEKIFEEAFLLYEKKNQNYNDNWYKNGIYGIIWDIKRKFTRLDAFIRYSVDKVPDETAYDTIIDTFLYSIFLHVYFQEHYVNIST